MKNQNQQPEKNNQQAAGRTQPGQAPKKMADERSENSKNPKTEAPKKTDSRSADREKDEQAKRKDYNKH